MPHFITTLKFQDDDGLPFTLLDDLVYVTDLLTVWGRPEGRVLRVPKGFKTDLASIPRALWNVLPPIGRYDRAAVVHDWLYREGFTTRELADEILFEAMKKLKVGFTQRWVIYLGVRLGGAVAWKRYRR